MKLAQHQARQKHQILDPILPLINVVFLLLIFVMMMSSIESSNDYDIRPPLSTSDDPTGQRDLLLNITKDGRVALNGEPMNNAALIQYAQQLQNDQPGSVVKVKADAQVDALHLIGLMESLRIGGVENLVLLTEKEH